MIINPGATCTARAGGLPGRPGAGGEGGCVRSVGSGGGRHRGQCRDRSRAGPRRGVGRASVAVWARNEERNRQAVAALTERGVAASAATCDVSREGDVEAAMAATLERHGKIDAMFANAGVYSD